MVRSAKAQKARVPLPKSYTSHEENEWPLKQKQCDPSRFQLTDTICQQHKQTDITGEIGVTTRKKHINRYRSKLQVGTMNPRNRESQKSGKKLTASKHQPTDTILQIHSSPRDPIFSQCLRPSAITRHNIITPKTEYTPLPPDVVEHQNRRRQQIASRSKSSIFEPEHPLKAPQSKRESFRNVM